MKNTINVLSLRVFGIITLVAVLFFSSANCFTQSINSPDALKQYLDSQPANSPDKPIKVAMGANDLMLKNIAAVITSSGKYVSIEFTGSVLTTIPDYAFVDANTKKGCASLVYIIIPNSVKSIGDYAFAGCTSLFNVTIPNSVNSIGEYAFVNCNNLFSVNIPDSVTSIGNNAFQNCTNLRSVIMSTRITSIKSGTFYRCSSLARITIPASVTSIESQAFALCDSLASVTFQSKIPSNMFSNNVPRGAIPMYDVFPGDLRTRYLAGGPGTYTRAGGSAERSSGEGGGIYLGPEPPKPFTGTSTWRKQGETTGETATSYIDNGIVAIRFGSDYDKAIADFTEALRIDPNNASAFYYRAMSYSEKGEYDKAIADYTQVIRLQPNNANMYNGRGWTYYLKGDWERALTDANEAIRLDPNKAYIYDTRANAYYLKKDYDRAVADFETALRLDPNNTTYKQGLEKARKARGR